MKADEDVGAGAFGEAGAVRVIDIGVVAASENDVVALLDEAGSNFEGKGEGVGFFEAVAGLLSWFLAAMPGIEADGPDGLAGG